MIDLHSHVLPAIDDGPATIEDSIAMARAAERGGTRVLVATPHVNWRYKNESSTIARLTVELNERLAHEQIGVQIRAGAEIAMTRVEDLDSAELERLRLGAGPWLLLEPPFTLIATGLDGVVARLQRAGHRVVLAHPERCPALHRDPSAVESLAGQGVLMSLTAGSLTGRFGGEVRRFSRWLIERGLIHNVTSDAHDVLKRPPSVLAELASTELGELADWLTDAVPAAILDGTEIPPRPTALPALERRSWRARLGLGG